jgi:Bacterial pullanase-associated domain.
MHYITIHYYRLLHDYDGWTLWTWQPDAPGTAHELPAVRVDAHGAVFHVPLPHDAARVGFLPKFRAWEAKDGPDRFWQPGDPHALYLLEGDDELYTTPPSREPWLRTLFADTAKLLYLTFNRAVACADVTPDSLHISQRGERLVVVSVSPVLLTGAARVASRQSLPRPAI